MRFPYSGDMCTVCVSHSSRPRSFSGERAASGFDLQPSYSALGTISGRGDYTDPGEKFENVTMMLFESVDEAGNATVKLVDTMRKEEITEQQYFVRLLEIYNRRNPHALIEALEEEMDEGVDCRNVSRGRCSERDWTQGQTDGLGSPNFRSRERSGFLHPSKCSDIQSTNRIAGSETRLPLSFAPQSCRLPRAFSRRASN
jgi:hypothetical protein